MITITNEYSGHKVVIYFGTSIIVPFWINYLTTDKQGSVFGFSKMPYYKDDYWLTDNPDYPGKQVARATINMNPEHSMVKL